MQRRQANGRLVLLGGVILGAIGISSGALRAWRPWSKTSRPGPAATSTSGPGHQRAMPAIYRGQLTKRGIKPTVEGLWQYLRSWVPRSVEAKRIAKLIEQLGDEDFQTRRQATQALISMWPASKTAVLKARTSADLEVRFRAARIQKETLTRPADLALVLRIIEHAQLQGMIPTLLQVLPHCPNDSIRRRIWSMIPALARPADAEAFAKALSGGPDAARIAAAIGLLKLDKGGVAKGLSEIDDKASGLVRLAAARLMCFGDRRESLAVLCGFLKSPSAEVRAAAALALYDLTGKPMPFLAYDQAASAPQAGQWTQWLSRNPPKLGPAAKMPRPCWPRNIALDKAVTSAIPESQKYCLTRGLQASHLTDGLLSSAAAPGSCRIDYTIDLRRTADGLELAASVPQGYRINRIVVEWKSFGATRPNKRGGVYHYVQKYEVMYQSVGSTQWVSAHRCNVPPVKEPEQLARAPLVLKYVPDKRRTMIGGIDLRRVGRLRLTASGPNWLGAFELEAYGVSEPDRENKATGKENRGREGS